MKIRSLVQTLSAAVVTGALLAPGVSQAVPSFARQTGLDCATCHTVFPQLTPFGRMFKLNGYTMASGMFNNQPQENAKLSEDTMAPLSAMFVANYTSMKKEDTGAVGNGSMAKDTVQFPQQFSIFYAGRISDYMGAFAQVTLDSSNSFGMDNADIRYAKTITTKGGTPVTYGVSLNNSPTVEDISNSTPVWGFPFTAPDYGNAPAYGTLLGTGAFAQTTAGAVAYAMVNNSWYGALGAYHDTQASSVTPGTVANPPVGTPGLKAWAPYARLAYQKDFGTSNFDVGAFAMNGKVATDVTYPVATGKFNDVGVDGQYQYINNMHTATIRARYVQEKLTDAMTLGYGNDSVKIHDATLNGEYYYDRMYGAGLGYFATGGDADTFYADSINGKPDSSGWITELHYVPWLNTKFSLQYTIYSKFDGGKSYISGNTGLERSAKDNNTLYASAWFMF